MLRDRRLFFVLLSILYFSLRITNLTLLPVFGDEAIYLDWAWRMTHEPGLLYYSLSDGKQPLLLWIFGIFENFFRDPLFAGRLVSVIFGYFTLIAILKIGKEFFSLRTAYISGFFYVIIPLFSFFDRQALMEAAVSAVGVWAAWYFLSWLKGKDYRTALKLGVVLGIGIFIKSTVFIFLLTCVLLGAYFTIKEKSFDKGLKSGATLLGSMLITISLLLINPLFWGTLSMNSRYSNTLRDLLNFPLGLWINNLLINFEIMFFFLTPLIFFSALGGIFFIIREKKFSEKKYLLIWVVCSLVLQTVLVKGSMSRYLVSFLPLTVVFSAYFVDSFIKYKPKLGIVLFFLTIAIPFALTVFSLLYPPDYLSFYKSFTKQTDFGYVQSSGSGYGIDNLVDAINKIQTRENKEIFIGVAENAGIPESALQMYYQKNPLVTVTYFGDSTSSLDEYDCMKADRIIYFVSRNEETPGITKFLEKIDTIRNDLNTNTFGIWKLKEECTGKTVSVSLEKV